MQVDAGIVTNAADLFTYFDEDNNSAKIYRFSDLTAGNGYFMLERQSQVWPIPEFPPIGSMKSSG